MTDDPGQFENRPAEPADAHGPSGAQSECLEDVARRDDPLLPPAPPGVRYVRVPVSRRLVVADDVVRDRIEHYFHWPMIILALAILPLLAWEFFWPPQPGTWQWWASAISLVVIWLAFFVEFVIKIAIAECRWEYARRNWLDIVVLCLPLLRPLRVATVARTSRVYALRGVGMKLLRYGFTLVVGLEMTDRLLERFGWKREKSRNPREMTRHELMKELKQRRAEVAAWESWYADYQAYYRRLIAAKAAREVNLMTGDFGEADSQVAGAEAVDGGAVPLIRLVRPPEAIPIEFDELEMGDGLASTHDSESTTRGEGSGKDRDQPARDRGPAAESG